MASNYGEKQFTKFFNDQLMMMLRDKMRSLGFPIHGRENILYGRKFDLWFLKRHVGCVIIESEMVGWHDYYNVTKLRDIGLLKWRWRNRNPQVTMFQVFSPKYSQGVTRLRVKDDCIMEARELRKSHRNFTYFPLDMRIKLPRFERMVGYFQSHRYAAKQYYMDEIETELRRLSRLIIAKVKEVFIG